MNIKNCVPIILVNKADITSNKLGRGDSCEVFMYKWGPNRHTHAHTHMGMHKHMHTKKDNKLISYFPLEEADKTIRKT